MDWGNDDPVISQPPGVAAPASPTASSWGNDDPVASQQTLIPTQTETLSVQNNTGNFPVAPLATAAGAGLDAGLAKAATVVPMATAGAMTLSGLPTAATDVPLSAAQALSGYGDQANQAGAAISPGATTAGNVLSFVPQVLAGGEMLPEEGAEALGANSSRIAQALQGIKHGAPVAAALGTEQATQSAIDAIKQGASVAQAEKLYGVSLGAGTLANLLPAGAGGGLIKRALAGGAVNAVGGTAAQEAEHLAAPDYVPQPTAQGTLQQGGVGAVLASVLGHGAPTEGVHAPVDTGWGSDDKIITPAPTQAAPDASAPVVPPAQADAQQAAQTATAQVGGGSTAANLVAKNAAEAGLAPDDVAAHTAAADAMVKADPDAEVPLHPATPIDATGSVPLGGGGSTDNSVNFIDKRIPQFIDVPKPDGTVVKVDAHDVIANAHEAPEKTQLDEGKDYADAHNVNANTYEEAFLKSKYGVTHDAFNEALQPYLDRAESEGAGASDIPAKLDTKPYVDDGVEHLLDPNASKVVDDKGEPLNVYHGTANDFSEFADHSGESTAHATSPLGHFFTPDRASAEGYARNASEGRPADERVMQAQLDIKKPYTMPLDEAQAIETPDQARAVRSSLESQGYDGIHLPEQNAWVAFHPHQISLTGDNAPFHVEQQATREAVTGMAPEDRAAAVQSLGLDIAPHHEAEAISIADLVDKAVDAGAHPKDIIAAMTGTPAEKARKLWNLGNPHNDHASTESNQGAEVQRDRARSAEPSNPGASADLADGGAQTRVSGADSDAVDSTPAIERPAESEPTEDHVARSEPTEETTGIKHATVAEERALKGKDEVDYEGKRTFGDAWDTAAKKLEDDPGAGQALARTINESPRPLSAEESATLIQDRMRLKNSFRDANADIEQAIDDKDKNAEAVARAKLRTVEDAIEANDQASKASGYEQGFGLAARRMMSRQDYSMADLLTQAKAAAGRDLTPAERGQIERLSKMIEEKDAQIAELQKTRAQRKSGTTGGARKTSDQHFKDLSAQLKLIREEDQMKPGCVV